jgi:methionyl-tRNA formyltransferase
MENRNYLVATLKKWNLRVFDEVIRHYKGNWHLITNPSELTLDNVKRIKPKYIFFPHWSNIVPTEILTATNCVCFHETDLPYGRGGSPLQNLIALGHKRTVVTALKMSEELDGGPIYLKKPLSLEGLAEEIFLRTAYIVADMIRIIIEENPIPIEQTGKPTLFMRRKPSESKINSEINSLEKLFDHIRMLDADSYPKAFLESDGFRYEISRPALRTNDIIADVRITQIKGKND